MTVTNIFYVLVDSVRNYRKTNIDHRDKLAYMDLFTDESVYFSSMITSAPSTIMSVSAMMTSKPSYFLAKNYQEFKYNKSLFSSLPLILKRENFKPRSVIFFKEGREKFNSFFKHVPCQFFPKNVSHCDKSWSNLTVEKIFNNFISSKQFSPKDKNFFYLHFNCRNDPNTSEIVERTIEKIKKIDNDSLIILCSDHGYPDPDRGYTPEKIKRDFGTHDVVMTNDNLTIPFYVRFPRGKKVHVDKRLVSTLDIAPTILDILGLNYKNYEFFGDSLFALDYKENFVRSDARYLYQDNKKTSIMSSQYKLIYSHDERKFELFDLQNDPLEENAVSLNSSNEAKQFELKAKKFLFKTESVAFFLNSLESTMLISYKSNCINLIFQNKRRKDYLDFIEVLKSEFPYKFLINAKDKSIPTIDIDSFGYLNASYKVENLPKISKVKNIAMALKNNSYFYIKEPSCFFKDLYKFIL